MSYPSEYVAPLQRVTNVHCACSSGYAGARVSREDPIFYPGSGDGDEQQVQLENVGPSAFTVQLKQCRQYDVPGIDSAGTPTGTRFDVGSAQALVPGGVSTIQVSPWMEYLEFWCTTGQGVLRAQITGRTRWQKMAFDKSETTIADPTTWTVKPTPVPWNL